MIEAVKATEKYFAIPYGPSGTAPDNNVREFELYFERLEKARLGDLKRPDLLVFRRQDQAAVEELIRGLGGIEQLPFTEETGLEALLRKAVLAVESENSLWKSKRMPDFGAELTAQKRLGGKPGLKKTAVLPTIIIKEEVRKPLRKWQQTNKIPIHIWHVFYDQAFGIAFDRAEQLFKENLIEPTLQVFQAPGGATTKKAIFKIYYHYGYPLGDSIEDPKLVSASVEDKNGHLLPYVRFQGGRLKLSPEGLAALDSLAGEADGR